jgi:methylthioxylose transferase
MAVTVTAIRSRVSTGRAFQPQAAARGSVGRVPQIVILAGAFLTVATGLAIKATGGDLGADQPPFILDWDPAIDPLAAISAAVMVGALALAPYAAQALRSRLGFALFLVGLALALGLSLNLARHGVRDWYAIFDTSPRGSFEAHNEYLPGLPALSYGVRFYLDRFAELVPSQPVNVAGHPPGLLLTVHLLGLTTATRMAALCIGAGALVAPLTYDLGRTLLGEERGRQAGLFATFAPSTLIFGVVSADYLYATLGLAVACLLVRPTPVARAAGVVMAALAAFFSWLLLALPAWAAVVVWRRERFRRAALMAAACVLAFVAFNGVLALWAGYDPVGALRATNSVYRNSIAMERPYAFWAFGSPTAWGAMLGLPTLALAGRALGQRAPAAMALAAIVAVGALLGFTKAETERIWLPFVPLACVAAAGALPSRHLRPVVYALGLQALAVELLFDTIW